MAGHATRGTRTDNDSIIRLCEIDFGVRHCWSLFLSGPLVTDAYETRWIRQRIARIVVDLNRLTKAE